MSIKRISTVAIMAAVAATLALSASCGGKKTAPPPKDPEPALRENKANMMDRMDIMTEEEEP